MACSGNSVRRLTTIVWRSAFMDSWFTSHRRYVRTSRTARQSFRSWSCTQQGRSARHLSLFAATALAATLVAVAPALGHGFAGKRFFPATLATDDPFVAAESFSTFTPTLFFGKGFGDLPQDVKFLRPLAVTGLVGVGIPSRASTTTVSDEGDAEVERHPHTLEWGFAVEYSVPYLQSFV